MSSLPDTPKPYQSRLFNFINRNYIKINSQINTKFREWGYILKGGLRGILIPFLWLWQKTTHLRHTFNPSEKATVSLPVSACDEVIVTVKEKMIEQNFPLLLTHDFQGLASQIKNKKIVAVLKNNIIKDIIPTQKQEEIFLLITSLVEIYEDKHHHSHLILWIDQLFAKVEGIILRRNVVAEESSLSNPSQGDSVDVNKEKNLSLKHLIEAAIDYFFGGRKSADNLKGKIAKNIDSFPSQNQSNILPSSNSQENNPSNLSTFQGIVKQSQETIENIIPVVKNVGSQMISQGLNQVNNLAQNLENSVTKKDDDPFQIKLIILAAIEFFFYQNKAKNSFYAHNKRRLNPRFTESLLVETEIEDPWLSWHDLYGEKNENIAPDHNDIEENKVYYLKENQEDNIPNQNITKKENSYLVREKKANIKQNKQYNIERLNQEKENNINYEIEAKVIKIKYEKHFLEVVLDKLDKLILWLEELIVRVIKFIKNSQLFSGNK